MGQGDVESDDESRQGFDYMFDTVIRVVVRFNLL